MEDKGNSASTASDISNPISIIDVISNPIAIIDIGSKPDPSVKVSFIGGCINCSNVSSTVDEELEV